MINKVILLQSKNEEISKKFENLQKENLELKHIEKTFSNKEDIKNKLMGFNFNDYKKIKEDLDEERKNSDILNKKIMGLQNTLNIKENIILNLETNKVDLKKKNLELKYEKTNFEANLHNLKIDFNEHKFKKEVKNKKSQKIYYYKNEFEKSQIQNFELEKKIKKLAGDLTQEKGKFNFLTKKTEDYEKKIHKNNKEEREEIIEIINKKETEIISNRAIINELNKKLKRYQIDIDFVMRNNYKIDQYDYLEEENTRLKEILDEKENKSNEINLLKDIVNLNKTKKLLIQKIKDQENENLEKIDDLTNENLNLLKSNKDHIIKNKNLLEIKRNDDKVSYENLIHLLKLSKQQVDDKSKNREIFQFLREWKNIKYQTFEIDEDLMKSSIKTPQNDIMENISFNQKKNPRNIQGGLDFEMKGEIEPKIKERNIDSSNNISFELEDQNQEMIKSSNYANTFGEIKNSNFNVKNAESKLFQIEKQDKGVQKNLNDLQLNEKKEFFKIIVLNGKRKKIMISEQEHYNLIKNNPKFETKESNINYNERIKNNLGFEIKTSNSNNNLRSRSNSQNRTIRLSSYRNDIISPNGIKIANFPQNIYKKNTSSSRKIRISNSPQRNNSRKRILFNKNPYVVNTPKKVNIARKQIISYKQNQNTEKKHDHMKKSKCDRYNCYCLNKDATDLNLFRNIKTTKILEKLPIEYEKN